jgi:hypothetical protein
MSRRRQATTGRHADLLRFSSAVSERRDGVPHVFETHAPEVTSSRERARPVSNLPQLIMMASTPKGKSAHDSTSLTAALPASLSVL